jgi:hydrogenase maturation protease
MTGEREMTERVLVAGVGNLFLGDDGFGPEVVRRLRDLPSHVSVVDYGIRGLYLAYDLLEGYGTLIIVDAVPGSPPGRVDVLQVTADDIGDGELDAHGMNPVAVLASLERLGGTLPRTYVIGCRVQAVDEGIGLSAPVAAAVPDAISAVHLLVARLAPAGSGGP